MIHALYLAAVLTLSSPHIPDLVPFQEGGLWGYKNWQNEWVIEPQYHLAYEFSDGIAAVRLDGYYHFINESGQILNSETPKYDFAWPYFDGRCLAHTEEGYVLLDENLETITDGAYYQLHQQGNLYLANRDSQYYVLNRDGQVIDGPFVGQFVQLPSPDRYLLNALIEGEWVTQLKSTNGEVLLETLESHQGHDEDHLVTMDYVDGYPTLHVYTMDGEKILDLSGREYDVVHAYFDGFPFLLERYTRIAQSPNETYNLSKEYVTISKQGKVTPFGDEWTYLTPIQNHRCVGQHADGGLYLLDEEGEIVNKRRFDDVRLDQLQFAPLLSNGTEVVRIEDSWVLIDEDGNTIQTCPTDTVDQLRNYIPERGMAIFTHPENNRHFYIWVLSTNEVFGVYDYISLPYSESYIMVRNEDHIEYISEDGSRVSSEVSNGMKPLNIDSRMEATVRVGSPRLHPVQGLGGWSSSENHFEPYTSTNLRSGIHVIVSSPEASEEFPSSISREVQFINLEGDTLIASAQDSRLNTLIEAKNADGEWVPIQIYRGSWCGNSYHEVYLPTGNAWNWRIPEFEGGFETELRVAIYGVMTWDNGEHSEPFTLYSEPYPGSINPAQFWRENMYSQRGLMHPYL